MAVPAVTADQMQEIDRIAMEETGPNLFQMMENAGRNLCELALDMIGENYRENGVVILAGSGGNGGGGICAGRHLANHLVSVYLVMASPLSPLEVPAWQLQVYGAAGGKVVESESLQQLKPYLIIDALIGYSLRGAPEGRAAELISWANQLDVPVLSLDVPSGVHATSGEIPGRAARPHTTMTLALPKTGLLPRLTGNLILADIGIPAETYRQMGLVDYSSPFLRSYRVALKAK
jgi:NAD(P)H-hydrate epimerase